MENDSTTATSVATRALLAVSAVAIVLVVALIPPPLYDPAPADAAPAVTEPVGPMTFRLPIPSGGVPSSSTEGAESHPADAESVDLGEAPVPDVSDACPEGWRDLGGFKLTAYVLAIEDEFDEDRTINNPCGLEGRYRRDFLFSTKANPGGVMMQGSGLTLDGRYVHYVEREGRHCFEVLSCAKTAYRTCAKAGRTVAVDRRMIPLGAELLIEGVGARVAEDTGGRVLGRHIDVYRGDELSLAAAQRETRFGRRVCIKAQN